MKAPLLALLPLAASANLVITEVMPSSRHSNNSVDGDWWELTNKGASAVNLGSYSWDDSSNLAGQQTFPAYTIQAGETVIILDETSGSIAPFRASWRIPNTVKIFHETEMGGFAGLGGGGDSLFVYLPNGALSDSFAYPSSTAGASFEFFDDGSPVPGGLSQKGLYGADDSILSPSDIGSPGTAAPVPGAVAPQYFAPFDIYWPVERNLNTSEFLAVAIDPNPADTITVTVLSKPDWLTLVDQGSGIIQLSGTPTEAEIGSHTFELRAQDDSGVTTPNTQVFSLYILPQTSPIILNEYNAVGPQSTLDGIALGDVGAPTDTYFGQIEGNGGEWIEFVLAGSDGEASMDIRGVRIEITSDDSTRVLKLSQSIALSEIPVGTILTFSETLSSKLNITADFQTTGHSWSNIWMYDPILIDQDASTHPAVPAIGSNNTRVTVYSPSGDLTYGPSGESVGAIDSNANKIPDDLLSVNDTEIYKLEQNPLANVDPFFGLYDDGATSTFGSPNQWSNGTMTQSFAAFIPGNAPPIFGMLPGLYATKGSYLGNITVIDPEGQPVTISIIDLPSFLTFTDNGGAATIQNNRPLTVADIGTYDIVLQADDGAATLNRTFYPFRLNVVNPIPTVVLNEYNAVSSTKFLNGGSASSDEDGLPNAADNHFGRIAGNGGDWFELAVVGNGEVGTVDLRGWKIDIGKPDASGAFVTEVLGTLTNNAAWSAVRAGTLLTFTKFNTAQGGLDTDLNRTVNFDTEGWGWSNINLVDSSLILNVNFNDIDIDSNNTQFRLFDSAGLLVFGPVGEGVISDISVGSEEIFELEADPSPSVGINDNASGTGQSGYDDSSSSSTFGAPNIFLPIGVGEVDRTQDFTPYISLSSTYASWATGFGIESDPQTDDNDGDGWSNIQEYLFGGDPTSGTSAPSISVDAEEEAVKANIRVDDPSLTFVAQRSSDLLTWLDTNMSQTTSPSQLGTSFITLTISYEGPEETHFFRVTAE